MGITYKTAYRWFKSGLIKGRQLPTGTILVDDRELETKEERSGVASKSLKFSRQKQLGFSSRQAQAVLYRQGLSGQAHYQGSWVGG